MKLNYIRSPTYLPSEFLALKIDIDLLIGPGRSKNFLILHFFFSFPAQVMADRVSRAREAIGEIESRAASIKEDIQILMDTDERMRTDEVYRNRIINEKLREVQKLQEESQVHQRIILQAQASSESGPQATTGQRVTRSRASAAGATATGISSVAANIQNASRQASRYAAAQFTGSSTHRKTITEDEQRRSVKALHDARTWLVEREKELGTMLETGLGIPDQITLGSFQTIQSIRIYADAICARHLNPLPGDTEKLRDIIQFVQNS
jgi:hypothetical protein